MADVEVIVCDEKSLALLLRGAAEAHHIYEANLEEVDANWPEWYAQWLCERFATPVSDVCSQERFKFAGGTHKAQATVESLPQAQARVQTYAGPVSESFADHHSWNGKIYEHGPGWIAEAAVRTNEE